MNDIGVVVLAGGKGTRMNNGEPKVLSKLLGKPLIFWLLDTLGQCGLDNIVVVSGHQGDRVETAIKKAGYVVKFTRQEQSMGTAHALSVGLNQVSVEVKTILVLFGDDSSLYSGKTIKDLIEAHKAIGRKGTLLVTTRDYPTELGALMRDGGGNVVGIMTKGQMEVRGITGNEIMCGAVCFDRKWIEENIKLIPRSEISGEYPLPGIIKVAAGSGDFFGTTTLLNDKEWTSVNTPEELKQAEMLKLSLTDVRTS